MWCKKHSKQLSREELEEKRCRTKREYTNKQGERIVIICPHLTDNNVIGLPEAYIKNPNSTRLEKMFSKNLGEV